MPAAIPIVAAVVGAAGSASAANQQKQAAKGAANAQMDIANRAMEIPGYVKKSKNMLFGVLGPAMQQYAMTGQIPELMPESMLSDVYNTMRTNADEGHKKGRDALDQSLTGRGLDYGNVGTNALSKYDSDYEKQMAEVGADIAYKGRAANMANWTDYLNKIYGIFSGGKAQQTQLTQTGLGLASDSIAANYAGQAGYYNTMSQIPAQMMAMYSMYQNPSSGYTNQANYAPTGQYGLPPNH